MICYGPGLYPSKTGRKPIDTTAPRRAPRRASRQTSLVVLCTGFLMVILDGTIVSVALPTIQEDLDFGASRIAWVVNAYLVAFGGLLLLAGRLGDLVGRRKMFTSGLAVFVFASLLCGLAQNPGQLIGARFLQGAGGAMSSAVILGMLVALFPDPREQARAFGVYAFVGAAGASLGLVAGGVLTDALDWRWIFIVNLPIGIATFILAFKALEPEQGLGLDKGADAAGAALVVAALLVGLYGIVGAEEHGFGSAHTVGVLVGAAGLLAGFMRREATARTPLIPLRFFGARGIAAANGVQLLMIAGYFGQQFLVALYLQRVLGFAPAAVGIGMLPIAIAIGATSLGATARLIDRFSARSVLLLGMSIAGASLAVLGRCPADGAYLVDVLGPLVVLGVGAGLSMPALTTIAMSEASPTDAGLASGMFNTTQQVASSIGFAVLATFAATRTDDMTRSGRAMADALASGYGLGFLAAAMAVLGAIALAIIWLPRGGTPSTVVGAPVQPPQTFGDVRAKADCDACPG